MQSNLLTDCARLCRLWVTLMVGVAAAFGYLAARPRIDAGLLYAVSACMALAAACSLWNQVQERTTDALMRRTADRPVAAGRFLPLPVALVGLPPALLALGLLYAQGGLGPALVGGSIILVYNGLYTPLKKVTGFALLVGAAVGALPPVLGWLVAGGDPASPQLVVLYGVYYLWQVPHFWLRVEKNEEEYRQAGFPLPPLCLPRGSYSRLLGLWFYAFAAALLMVPLFPLIESPALRVAAALVGMSVFMGGGCFFFFVRDKTSATRQGAEARIAGRPSSVERLLPLIMADGAMLALMTLILADRILFMVG